MSSDQMSRPGEDSSNSLPPRQQKTSNARGMPGGGGMFKLQFDWYKRANYKTERDENDNVD